MYCYVTFCKNNHKLNLGGYCLQNKILTIAIVCIYE